MPAFAYLDHNATSPLRPAAFDAMVEALRAGGNPSSVHRAGRAARSRGRCARAARWRRWSARCRRRSSSPRGGTEANNMALAGQRPEARAGLGGRARQRAEGRARAPRSSRSMATASSISPRSSALLARDRRAGAGVGDARQQRDRRDPAGRRGRARSRTRPARWCIATRCRRPARCRSICTASASTISACRPTSSAARPGVGALVVRSGAPFAPDRRGGGQECDRRAGTENLAGIAGFGAAADGRRASGLDGRRAARPARERRCCDRARRARVRRRRAAAAQHELHLHARREGRDPGDGARSRRRLRQRGRRLLVGQGAPLGRAGGHGRGTLPMAETAIRISFGWNTDSDDIERLIAAWRDLYIRVAQSDIRQARAA